MAQPPDPTSDAHTLGTLRTLLLALVLFGSAGLATELVVLEHWEEWQQQLPLALLIAILLGTIAFLVRPGPRGILFLRGVAAATIVSGIVGAVLHWRSNAALEMEIDPSIPAGELFREALGGGVPTLAPGAMIQLGLLIWIALWGRSARPVPKPSSL